MLSLALAVAASLDVWERLSISLALAHSQRFRGALLAPLLSVVLRHVFISSCGMNPISPDRDRNDAALPFFIRLGPISLLNHCKPVFSFLVSIVNQRRSNRKRKHWECGRCKLVPEEFPLDLGEASS